MQNVYSVGLASGLLILLLKHETRQALILGQINSCAVLLNFTKPVTVQSDSSQSSLGCCLMQEEQPVAFTSRALTPTEKKKKRA